MSFLCVPPTEKATDFPQPGNRAFSRPSLRNARTALLCGIMLLPWLPGSAVAGLAYWGSEGFVKNADSKNRIWTPDFSMTLGVFQAGFSPSAANREEWLEKWVPLSVATFDATESRFAGVVDLSIPLPAGASAQVFFWARNGFDLTKGPEWLLVSRPEWQWPASSAADAQPVTWTTGSFASTVMGAIGLNGRHLTTSRVVPVPVAREAWLASYFPGAPGKCKPDADPDGDGLSNHTEYLLGSNPADPGSRVCPEIRSSLGSTLLTLKRNPYAASKFAVEASTNLRQWDASATETLLDDPGLIQVRVSGKDEPASRFFRFKLEETKP